MSLIQFTPPGPVSAAFIADRSSFSGIMGPMGSAKTSSIIMKSVALAQEQRPSIITGERLFKFGIVRDTLSNMKRTTMKSIEQWFPAGGKWGGGGASSEPAYFKINFKLKDGTVVRLWYDFVGLDVHNIEQLAKGWELTGYWLNEGDMLSPDVKTYLDARIGRYPSRIHGEPSWYGGIVDYNAPDTDNYLYKLFEEDRPKGHKLFKQPSGLAHNAENKQNLPADYYERMVVGKEKWWINRNVKNIYGFSREGEPVYEDYNDDFHCGSEIIQPIKGITIKMYADAALHPAIVFTQVAANGQRRILGEVAIEGGAVQIGKAAMQYAAKHFPDNEISGGYADPSADKRDEKDSDADTWIDTLNRTMGLTGHNRFRPAPTNDLMKRLDSVRNALRRVVDSGKPGLRVSAAAKIARKGFNSDYRYKIRANGAKEDKPEKSRPHSDVADAIQYFCLDDGGYEEAMALETRLNRKKGWNRMRQAKLAVKV